MLCLAQESSVGGQHSGIKDSQLGVANLHKKLLIGVLSSFSPAIQTLKPAQSKQACTQHLRNLRKRNRPPAGMKCMMRRPHRRDLDARNSMCIFVSGTGGRILHPMYQVLQLMSQAFEISNAF